MKKLFFILFASFCFHSAQAQILNMSVNFEPLHLSDDFLRNLAECRVYADEQASELDGVKVKTAYMVEGLKDGICRITVRGESNTDVIITQTCELSPQQASDYSSHLRKYQERHYSPRFDDKQIANDKDYQAALQIMTDRKLCRVIRSEMDPTKTIRRNLTTCSAAESVQILPNLQITRQIVKKEDELCLYDFQVIRANPETKELMRILNSKDVKELKKIVKIEFNFSCSFTEEQIAEYTDILQNQVVPEEEGLDFSAVQRPDYSEEMTFIMNNCTMVKK